MGPSSDLWPAAGGGSSWSMTAAAGARASPRWSVLGGGTRWCQSEGDDDVAERGWAPLPVCFLESRQAGLEAGIWASNVIGRLFYLQNNLDFFPLF